MFNSIRKQENAIEIDGQPIKNFQEFSDGNNKFYTFVCNDTKIVFAPHGLFPSHKILNGADMYIGSAFSENDKICVLNGKSHLFFGKNNQSAEILKIAPQIEIVWIDLKGNNIASLAKSDDELLKVKVYLKPQEKPPEGTRVQRGPRGGEYYETSVRISQLPHQSSAKFSAPAEIPGTHAFERKIKLNREIGAYSKQKFLDFLNNKHVKRLAYLNPKDTKNIIDILTTYIRIADPQTTKSVQPIELESAINLIKYNINYVIADLTEFIYRDYKPEWTSNAKKLLISLKKLKSDLYKTQNRTSQILILDKFVHLEHAVEASLFSSFFFQDWRQSQYMITTAFSEQLRKLIDELSKLAKSKIYLKPGEKPPEGATRYRGPRGGQYYETEVKLAPSVESKNKDKEDFLYDLNYNYIVDFHEKNPKIFDNFHNNINKKLRENSSILTAIGDISNNFPEDIVFRLSQTPVLLSPEEKYSKFTDYWAAAYDDDYNSISINENVYNSLSRDYFTQEQFHRALLHEYAHLLYYKEIISEKLMFALWDTKERVSSHAKTDFDENAAEAIAAFLMAMSTEGDSEHNMDLVDFKEDFPKTYELLFQWLTGLKNEN